MASGDLIAHVPPAELHPANAPVGWMPQLIPVGSGLRGHALRKLDTEIFYFVVAIPLNGTPLSTGLTFKILLDEGAADTDPGKVVRLAITCKKLVSTTDDLTDAGGGTETAADVTMNATTGLITVGSIAIATAAADTPIAGGHALVKIRRVGSNAADTHTRSVVLLGVWVIDT